MHIALVLAPWYRREVPSPEVAMTVGLLRREGYDVTVYDFNNLLFNANLKTRTYWKYFIANYTEQDLDDFFELTTPFFAEYASHIIASAPEMVVFKIVGHTYYNALKLAEVIKQKKRDIPVIFSGMLPAEREEMDKTATKQHLYPFDYVIRGEDEVALPMLIKALAGGTEIGLRRRGKVIDCLEGPFVERMDDLPLFDFSSFDLGAYKFPDQLEMFTSRGCPRRCAFCLDWKTEKKFRTMSGERMYEQVERQYSRYRTRHIHFVDKMIDGDMRVLREFARRMREGINTDPGRIAMSWSGDLMVREELTADMLQQMRDAGCGGVGFGIESGSDKVLADMRKGFSTALAERVIRDTHATGILTAVNIMVGFPTETREDFARTVDFVERNRQSIDEVRISYQGCLVHRNSEMAAHPEQYNLEGTDPEFWRTKDGLNTHEERARRYEELTQRILALQIPLRVNSRITRTGISAEHEKSKLAMPVTRDIDLDKIMQSLEAKQEIERIISLRMTGKAEETMTALQHYLGNHPDSVDALILSGELSFEKGDVEGARRQVARALELWADNTWALRVMGRITAATGDLDGAEKYFNQAIELEDTPNRAWSYLELGRLHRKRGDMQRSRESFEKALSFHPESPEIQKELRSL